MFQPEGIDRPGARLVRVVCMAGLALGLTACATPAATTAEPAPEPVSATVSANDGAPAPQATSRSAEAVAAGASDFLTQSGALQTATQPLSDLNLLQARIPPVLTAAQQGPYALPADSSCAALQVELLALDAALGPDIDSRISSGADPGLMGKAVDFVGDAAMDSVRGTVNSVVDGVIPFRSWVRRLSGAERYSKAVAAAIRAGTLRRPFLKGWARAAGCVEGPPAPLKVKAEP